jgi:hypothetical protein
VKVKAVQQKDLAVQPNGDGQPTCIWIDDFLSNRPRDPVGPGD